MSEAREALAIHRAESYGFIPGRPTTEAFLQGWQDKQRRVRRRWPTQTLAICYLRGMEEAGQRIYWERDMAEVIGHK